MSRVFFKECAILYLKLCFLLVHLQFGFGNLHFLCSKNSSAIHSLSLSPPPPSLPLTYTHTLSSRPQPI